MLRKNKKAVQMTAKIKLYRYLKISIPQKMLVNQILIFQVVLILTKNYCPANQSSVTSDVKKSKESKLVSYEIRFRDFYFSSVENGWLCKICCSFSHGNVGNRTFVDKPEIIRRATFGNVFRSFKFKSR